MGPNIGNGLGPNQERTSPHTESRTFPGRGAVVAFSSASMSKHFSPLLGYNNNVRHKNRVFHIQTEDSGVKHPHIITHLFMDGGRILKSVREYGRGAMGSPYVRGDGRWGWF